MTSDQIWQYVFVGLTAVGSIGLLLAGFRSMRRKRLIENVPTSKVEGVFLGLTEVKGTAEGEPCLRSYLAEVECVWYSYTIEEHWRKTETYRDSKGEMRERTSSGWTTVKSADVREPFYLRDDTGRLRVVPAEAEIEGDSVFSRTCGTFDPVYYGKGPATAIAHSTHERRFTETAIRPRSQLYVMGTARLREDVVEPEIAYDAEEEMFLISTRSEESIVSSYGIWAPVKLMGGAVLGNASPLIFFYDKQGGIEAALSRAWPVMVGVSVLYALAVFVYYLFLLYNGLVSVRNRVQNAWSQIDIQLKRRFDLIPNLVACVKGYATHEKDVLSQLAEIRVEGASGGRRGVPVGGAALAVAGFANAQTQALGGLYGIVERYPKLKADKSFQKLMDELSRTEQKIALARTFFNESVTALNNRIETLPDALIAGVGGFKKADYFKIEEFEKAPPSVKMADDEPPKLTEPAPRSMLPQDQRVKEEQELS